LLKFLETYGDGGSDSLLDSGLRELYELCPRELAAVEYSRSIQSLITSDLNSVLLDIVSDVIDQGNEELALFCIGLCDLGDSTDDVLERFLDLVDEGMNLNTLSISYRPRNAFQVNALLNMIYWPDFPDWARAHLITRDDIGLVCEDRDGVIEYLGCSDNLGSDTIIALSCDIAKDKSKYSTASIKALKAFVSSDFSTAASLNNADIEEMQSHFDSIGEYYILESKKALDAVPLSADHF
jgi:hypothetical protein